MDLKQYKQKLLKTPKFRPEYEKQHLAREIARLKIARKNSHRLRMPHVDK